MSGCAVDGFEEFYLSSYRRLFHDLVLITADRADAQDVLQEAYLRAASGWRRVRTLDNPEAWVRRVAINRSVDLHRRRRRQRGAYERLRPDEQQPEQLSVEVLDALRRLPVEQRQVVVLHHLLGEPVSSISVLLNRPEGTVKGQLVRGRSALHELLARSEEALHD